MAEPDERIGALEERVERLERQVAALLKKGKASPSAGRGRDLRDRYDSLDYPER